MPAMSIVHNVHTATMGPSPRICPVYANGDAWATRGSLMDGWCEEPPKRWRHRSTSVAINCGTHQLGDMVGCEPKAVELARPALTIAQVIERLLPSLLCGELAPVLP